MGLKFSDEIEAFRQEVRTFIRDSLPEEIRQQVAEERMDLSPEDQKRWHRTLYERGWSCPSWPAEYGGTGWSYEQQYVFEREIAQADAPRFLIYGVQMLGPSIIEFGTEEQKQRFLPGILSGEVMWCQGFSEPNAGSDLAALQCRALRDGDDYVLNGSKLWTSEAHVADWMFGLFRSDSSGKKQFGITFLMLDMASAGLSVQPILTFDGSHEVNQVFFDDVRVPVANRLGEEHQGWAIAKYLLGLERFGTAEISRSLASLARLKKLAAAMPCGAGTLADDADFMDELAKAEIDLRALEITEQRFLFGPGGADALGPEASMLKICGTEVQQRILELTLEALGQYGQLLVEDGVPEGGKAPPQVPGAARHAARAYFNYRKTSIYSGSNEIQKNIIAKAVLGL